MAATAGARRKGGREDRFFALGQMGRKTGIELPEQERDPEHGLENMDNIFSPDKPTEASAKGKGKQAYGASRNADTTLSSESMAVGDSTIPEPTEVLITRNGGVHMPPPRSKSPVKTYLRSPPKRDASLGPVSVATRGDIRTTPRAGTEQRSVNRRLDFGTGSANSSRGSPQRPPPKSSTKNVMAPLTNGSRLSPRVLQPAFQSDEPVEEDPGLEDEYDGNDFRPMEDDEDVVEEEPEPEPVVPQRKAGRVSLEKERKASKVTAVKKGAGRPPPKRKELADPEEEPDSPPAKRRGRQTAAPNKKTGALAKKTKRPRDSLANESSPVVVQRGPPRPRHNTGLYIMRRETPDEGVPQTRAGRRIIKPLEYWKGETMEHDFEEITNGNNTVYMPTIRSVLRAEEVVGEKQRRGPRKGKASKRVKAESEDEDDEDLAEPWETEPGRILGDIREWNPEDPIGGQSDEREEEIALSSAAIITRDIPNSTFKFAKTLTLPFFGSGMVDLPPGSVKKPKNSRKMQMVFFVFKGRVTVTVNENTFRIGKGGMWQVPRGNFYSIENDYEKPARIFFSQGCEVLQEEPGDSQ